jgi:hypothetical protein
MSMTLPWATGVVSASCHIHQDRRRYNKTSGACGIEASSRRGSTTWTATWDSRNRVRTKGVTLNGSGHLSLGLGEIVCYLLPVKSLNIIPGGHSPEKPEERNTRQALLRTLSCGSTKMTISSIATESRRIT